jgi:hypothetical protein
MSTASCQLSDSAARSSVFSARWIINFRDDIIWFIGSVAASYVLFMLHIFSLVPLVPLVFVWGLFFDAPHGFATISRTYLDREERRSRGLLLAGSLLFFLLGPTMVLAGQGLIFFLFVGLWAYYHLVKQHYGFVILYKKKNDDLLPFDNRIDKLFLMTVFSYPLVVYLAYDAEVAGQIPAVLLSVLPDVERIFLVGTITTGGVWIFRQFQRVWLGLPLNLPKYLLLSAALPIHWLALMTPMSQKPLAVAAILTIFHNIQYNRLVWFHNRKYTKGEDGKVLRERYGAAAFINRRLLYFVLFGLIFGVICQLPRLYSFFVGAALAHYYLDSKIWRVRQDPTVGRALQVN